MGSDPRVAAYQAARAVWTKAWDEDWDLDASFKATCDAYLAALLAQDDTRDALIAVVEEWFDDRDADGTVLVPRLLAVLSGFSQETD